MAEHDLNEGAPLDAPAGDDAAAEPSLRDAIDAAFTEQSTDEPPDRAGQPRDDAGRFAPKTPAEAAQILSGAPKAAPQGITAPAPRPGLADGSSEPTPADLKAPAQWKPEAREQWQAVPPAVRAEVVRRERDFQAHLQQTAGFRDFVSAFEATVRPYEMFIRAENSNPLQATANLFQTAAELRVGTPQGKANLVAGICQLYGIDLTLLDNMLAQRYGVAGMQSNGQQQSTQVQQPQVFQDPRVDAYLMQLQAQQQQQHEAQQNEIMGETLSFAESHEFFYDVRDDMADMIEIAARRGQILPVEKAYEKACQLNPEVTKILSSRQSVGNARATTQAALRAKRAASSVKGESSPHGVTVPANDTLRASIEAAFESTGNRL